MFFFPTQSTQRTDDDFQVDDMFVSKAAHKQSEAKMEEKDRSMAIFGNYQMIS